MNGNWEICRPGDSYFLTNFMFALNGVGKWGACSPYKPCPIKLDLDLTWLPIEPSCPESKAFVGWSAALRFGNAKAASYFIIHDLNDFNSAIGEGRKR